MYAMLFFAAAAGLGQDTPLGNMTQSIIDTCHLEGWQFALRPGDKNLDGRPLVKVELSPTMPADQVACVYQTLSDWHQAVDGPPPVQVAPPKN